MKVVELRAIAVDETEIKSVGEVIVVDGEKHVIDAVVPYHEEFDGSDVLRVTYTLKQYEEPELSFEELQNL
jgi:hypothetical protein